MTKEEKIKDVYINLGFEWDKITSLLTENGVLILPSPDYKYTLKGYDNLIADKDHFVSFGKEGLKLQPKILFGINNNNGWVKIESEDDLPKEKNTYWVIDKFMETNPVSEFFDPDNLVSMNERWMHRMTHYQKIVKPEQPIY